MKATLTKPWGKHPPGTVIVDLDEAEAKGVRVNAARFAKLETEGYFTKPADLKPATTPAAPATPIEPKKEG
jgi:hypothetical protein